MESFVELDFRDGRFMVPAHLAAAMDGLQTYMLTYKEAVRQANTRMTGKMVDKAMKDHILGHFGQKAP